MSQECQILFLTVLLFIAIPLLSSDEDCERSQLNDKEWTVTCDSQTHQRYYCRPGQRVKDPCSSDNQCEYCPEGQYQDLYSNCKTCNNCTTEDDCCPGQVLIRQCTSDEDAKCGCRICPEEQTRTTCPTCPTCPTVCNMTNQTSTSDDTPMSSLSSADPNGDTTSSTSSSDTDGTTSSPTSAKATLSSDCKCVGWIIGFSVAVLPCSILFCVVLYLYIKGNGALCTRRRRRQQRRRSDQMDKSRQAPSSPESATETTELVASSETPSNDGGSESEPSEIIATKDREIHQLHKRIAELEERIQQSERSKKELPDSVDAADVIQKDKTDSGSTLQNSAPVESDGTTTPAEQQKAILNQAQKEDSIPTAASPTRDEPSSANKDRDVVSDKLIWDICWKMSLQEGKELARQLGLSDPVIENLEARGKEHKEIVYQLLMVWKKRKGEDATYCSLRQALKDSGRKDLHDNLSNTT